MKMALITAGAILIAWGVLDKLGDNGSLPGEGDVAGGGKGGALYMLYDKLPRPPLVGDWGAIVGGAVIVWWTMR